MRVLELFSGTHSIGKVCSERGYEVISLDLQDADINIDILEWDYTIYPVGYFDIIWASPPCATFSNLCVGNIGRRLKSINMEIYTREIMIERQENIGLPILNKTKEIINYFQQEIFFIENQHTSRMKNYMNEYDYYDVDYCMYSDFGYKKRTRIWTNLKNFNPKLCNKNCGNIINNKHTKSIGKKTDRTSLQDRYRVPFKLIRSLFDTMENQNFYI